MDDEAAKEITDHLDGVKRQLTHIKWLAAAVVIAVLALAWSVYHLGIPLFSIRQAISMIPGPT